MCAHDTSPTLVDQHLPNLADLHRRPGGRWDAAPAPHARGARTPRGAARPAAASASARGCAQLLRRLQAAAGQGPPAGRLGPPAAAAGRVGGALQQLKQSWEPRRSLGNPASAPCIFLISKVFSFHYI